MNLQPSISASTIAVRPESPIEAALSETNMLIEDLLGNTAELRARLGPILVPESSANGAGQTAGAPVAQSAALVGILESMAGRIKHANLELMDLRRRLAL